MALWNGLGQVATVAQLTGVDASGLIAMILEAVRTVSRNKEDCRHLARRAMMIGDLLQKLQGWDMMQEPEIRRPLDGLDDALREAYVLIASCQNCSTTYRFLMGWKQAEQFQGVQKKIDSYLQLYPFISHIDITRRLDQLCKNEHLSCSQAQGVGDRLGSSMSCSNNDARTGRDGSGLQHTESQTVQSAAEHYQSDEHQQGGHQELNEIGSTRKSRFTWSFWWLQDKIRLPYIPRSLDRRELGFSVFRFCHMKAATDNFSFENEIGHGGSATVYKGKIHGRLVAIKRYSTSGSISYRKGAGTGMLLDWTQRFSIILGIAQGVAYLHKYCGVTILHRDLKPSNVLLDSDMNPKITDFGIARLLGSALNEEVIEGTLGYVAPEYLLVGRASTKSDIYSFGVILIEMIMGKRSFKPSCQRPLHGATEHYAWELWTAGRSLELVDPSLRDEDRVAEILRCIQIGLLCVEPRPEDRPTMPDVIVMLSSESTILPSPKRIGYEVAEGGRRSYLI
ncbi:cysteine-rich receptor-like protein kinase 4 isoform X8 [Setaria viridis]|uniref:cysteine-rich receptor-like protein kinase 4 isoform X8 n=1 Tax=Setaria viridis TaxID=4556 RepID=UPI003B3A4E8D